MTIINPLLGSNFVTGPVFDPTLIGNSVWLDGSADFLKRDNFALSADGRKEFIFSMWIQRNEFGRAQTHFDLYPTGATSYNDGSRFTFPADDQLSFSVGAGGSSGGQKVSSAVYRDIGWYHVLISYNTNTSVTAASRHRLFVNGLEITDTSTYTAPPDNQSCIGSGTGNADLRIGKTEHPGIPYVPDAYFAQACYLEGKSFQAGDYAITDFLDSFTFGTNGSQYVPKADANIAALASTVGGNSFCLDFADSGGTDAANLGNDISSNNNDLTPTSMAAANQSSNTPSNVTATLNPLIPNASIAYSEGNTKITHTAFTQVVPATIFATSGKFYAEVLIEKTGTWAGYNGVVPADDQAGPNWVYPTGDGFIWVSNGTLNHVSAYPSVTTTYTNGDRLMFGLDVDNGWLFIGKNDTWYDASGNSFTDLTDSSNAVATTLLTVSTAGWTFAPGASHVSGTTTEQIFLEESSWAYTAPTNFVSLSSANLTAPTYQGIDYFTSTLYEGNGTGQRVGDFVPFTDAFNVANSAMFQHDEVRALSRTAGAPSSSGGKKGTWSVWYKTANIDTDNIFFDNGTTATNRFSLQMDASGQIVFIFAGTTILMTNADLKGGGLWRNLVLKVDTSLATASARAIMYIDGVEVTSFATDARASLTQDGELGYMDSGATQFVGSYNGVTANQWDGYFAETIFLDNQFLSADSFGQLDTSTNKWVPKDISGLTLGDQGFYLAYGGNFGTGNGAGDSTGNSNNLTEIGTWTGGDKFVDTPSANYATIDPVISNGSTPVTVSQGNLQGVRSASGFQQAYSNFSGFRLQENTGIYFAEVLVGSDTSNFNVGVLSGDPPSSTNRYLGQDSNTYGYDLDGRKVNNGAYATYGASYTAGDVIGIEIDTDTGAINFHKNGADQGQAFTAIVGPYNFAFASESGGGPGTFNFGQQMELGGASTTLNAAAGGRFKHTPPTGAKSSQPRQPRRHCI